MLSELTAFGNNSAFGVYAQPRVKPDAAGPEQVFTVEPVITHTPWWMAEAMGYYRSWLSRGGLKIDLKAIAKFLG